VICLSQPDTALLARCQSNDLDAFDALVARYKHKIYNYIFRMVGDSEEAEDLTQDVFVKMYVALPTFRNQASLNTWLYRIAGNICIDAHRKKVRRENAMSGDVLSLNDTGGDGDIGSDEQGTARDVPDASYEPYRLLATTELDSQIQMALHKLPEKMRAVLVLHDIEGFAYEEIAAVVQCPLGTVKSRLFNARMQMREYLKPYLELG
jgi:RNA polymerase sigma-70 factor (ECF subfamily)